MWVKIIIMTYNFVLTPLFPVKYLTIGQLISIPTLNSILISVRVFVLYYLKIELDSYKICWKNDGKVVVPVIDKLL